MSSTSEILRYVGPLVRIVLSHPYSAAGMLMFAIIIWKASYRYFHKPRGRAMSFNSFNMIQGSFPAAAKVVPPIINIVLFFEQCPSLDAVSEVVTRLQTFDRFRMVPKYDKSTNMWIYSSDCEFSRSDMISSTLVRNEVELKTEIHRVSTSDLSFYDTTPAYHLRRVDNIGEGFSAIILRIHHVIGDGMSLVAAMEKGFTDIEGNPVKIEMPSNAKKGEEAEKKKKKGISFNLVLDVFFSAFKVLGLAVSSFDSDILFTTGDKKNLSMTPSRKILYFPTLRLDFVKSLKNKALVTINDVMMAATSGAIRRYCLYRGDPLLTSGGKTCNRMLIPVAFPRSAEETKNPVRAMRNKWAFVSSEMPIHIEDSKERLNFCNKAMTYLKNSPMALVQFWIQNNILPLLPTFLAQGTALDLFKRHSMVFSNVPGPDRPLAFAGERVMAMQTIFPNLLPQALIVSYNGGVFMNMVVDDELITESDKLKSFFIEEVKELARLHSLSTEDSNIFLPASISGSEFSAAI